MSTGKAIGGALALMAGGLVLVATIMWVNTLMQVGGSEYNYMALILNLVMAMVVIVGGILGVVGKRIGGILVFAVGVIMIWFGIIYSVALPETWAPMFQVMSLLAEVVPLMFLTLEALMMLMGGVLIIAGGSN